MASLFSSRRDLNLIFLRVWLMFCFFLRTERLLFRAVCYWKDSHFPRAGKHCFFPIFFSIQRRTLLVRHVYWSISAFNKEWYIVHTALNELSTGGKLVRLGVLTVRKFRHPSRLKFRVNRAKVLNWKYRKSSIIHFKPIWGGLNRDRGLIWQEGLI